MLAKLNRNEILRGTGQYWGGNDYRNLTYMALEPVQEITYGGNITLPTIECDTVEVETESTVDEPADSEPESTVDESADSEPESPAPSSAPKATPLERQDPSQPVQHTGASAFRPRNSYVYAKDKIDSFLVFDHIETLDNTEVSGDWVSIWLSKEQADLELTKGQYRIVEERFRRASADLFGLEDLGAELIYLPGIFTAQPDDSSVDSSPSPIFILPSMHSSATHVLARMETTQPRSKLAANDSFHQLSDSSRLQQLRNGMPRLIPRRTLRQDAWIIRLEPGASATAKVVYLVIDLELSQQFELMPPEGLALFATT